MEFQTLSTYHCFSGGVLFTEMHDTFIAVIPAANFPGVLLTQLDNIKKVTTPSLDSDVVLVDTNNGLSFTLSVDLSQVIMYNRPSIYYLFF